MSNHSDRINQSLDQAIELGKTIHKALMQQAQDGDIEAIKLLIETGYIDLPMSYWKKEQN